MVVCCVLPLLCGGSGVYILGICAGGGDVDCDTSILNMSSSLFIAAVSYSPSCGMGVYGAGL